MSTRHRPTGRICAAIRADRTSPTPIAASPISPLRLSRPRCSPRFAAFVLPVPDYVPMPTYYSPPPYVAPPPPNVIYNNIHNTVVINTTTNMVTITKPGGKCRP
jgi:hypothetical protein